MKNCLYYCVLTILLSQCILSCSGDSMTSDYLQVDYKGAINEGAKKDTSFFKSYNIIPISEDMLIGNHHIFDIDDDMVFLADGKEILIMDRKDGKLLHKINKQGKGPGEYLYISGVCVDKSKEMMFVSEYNSKRILTYTFSGDFVKQYELEGIVSDVAIDKKGTMWACLKDYEFDVVKLNKEMQIAESYYPTRLKDNTKGLIIYNVLREYNDNICFNPYNCDTIYNVSTHKGGLVLNYGSLRMSQELSTSVGRDEERMNYINGEYGVLAGNYYFSTYFHNYKEYSDVWDVVNHKLVYRNLRTSENDIPGIPVKFNDFEMKSFWPKFVKGNRIYNIIDGMTANDLFPNQYSEQSNGFILEIEL